MRDIRVDLLRALGLAMIILAHASPPAAIMQLRNFDVPMMILISGMSFALSYKSENYLSYLWKRVKRLVFPIWILLSVYFGVLALLLPSLEDLSLRTIMRSYLLVDGIGYVWIIKVFLLVALASPFIYLVHKKISDNAQYFGIIFIAFICYEVLRIFLGGFFSYGLGKGVAQISHYLIPYALIFAIGLRFPGMRLLAVCNCMLVSAIIFISLAIFFWWENKNFVPTQSHKYPPTIYYFSYAIAVASAAWILSERAAKWLDSFDVVKRVVLFVAQNSIWVYLWHIPFIKFIQTNFAIKYVLVFVIAGCITFLQVSLVNHVLIRKTHPISMQRNLKMILTG